MPISQLDVRTGLIVIDLQEGFRGLPGNVPMAEVFERAGALARAFREAELPVVLVTVTPKEGRVPPRTEVPRPPASRPANFAEIVPELDAQPDDIRIRKHGANAFNETELHERLQEAGVTQVVVAGVTTSIGVESTVRAAFERGYNVAVPVDAMADRDTEAHKYSVGRVFPRMAETGRTVDILNMLNRTPAPSGERDSVQS